MDKECRAPIVKGNSPLAHKFEDSAPNSGSEFTAMGWINCKAGNSGWNNLWMLY